MQFYNPDGSPAEKSGNGLRIFARYLWDKGYVTDKNYDIFISGEIVQAQVEDDSAHTIRMTMGKATFDRVDEPVSFDGQVFHITAVSVGNPHCVIFGQEVSEVTARRYGAIIETAPMFPNRSNVQFAEAIDHHTLKIEIWERGAGYTLASGTSSCATAAAAIRTGRCDSPVEIRMAGGNVLVEVENDWSLTLTGTVSAVAEGTLAPEFAEQLKSLKS
jgi:diaminopimelate epimerase